MISIRRQLFNYAVPSIIGMLIVGVQSFIDGLFVSRGVGAIGLAAINLSMPMISAMLSVVIMIISGGIVITGIAKGRGNEQQVRGYTSLTFIILLVTVLLMSGFVLLNLKTLCYWLGGNDEVYPHLRMYLGIIGGGFFFYCIPNFTEAFTRLRGKPNWVFISGSICCIVNIVLDYFFVLRLGWGVKGAAIATAAANSTAAIVLTPNIKFGHIEGGWKEIGKIFYNGCSEMFTSVASAVTLFVINVVIMQNIGTKGVAALTIVCYLNFAVNMSIFGLSQALYPLMSFNLGAKNFHNIKELLKYSLLFGAAIGYGVYLIVLIFKPYIINMFANGDVELAGLTNTAATIITVHYLFSFFNIIASSFHTAIERPVESAVIAIGRSILFALLPLAVLLPLIGNNAIWLSLPIAEILTLFVSIPLVIKSMKKLKSKLTV